MNNPVRNLPKTLVAALALLPLLALGACGTDKLPEIGVPSGAPATAPASGLVRGRLELVGGLSGTQPDPVAGTITFTGADGSVATTDVDDKGTFAIGLSPGTYTLTGTSSAFEGGKGTCRTDPPTTTVKADGDTTADVRCQRK